MFYNKSITATVYIVHDQKVLLHQHKKYHTWFPVGGHVEPDEFPHQTAAREVLEESGLDVSFIQTEIAPQIDLGSVERLPSPFCIFREGIGSEEEFFDLVYIAVASNENVHPEKGESKVFCWFTEKELQEYDIKPHIRNTALAVLHHVKKLNDQML